MSLSHSVCQHHLFRVLFGLLFIPTNQHYCSSSPNSCGLLRSSAAWTPASFWLFPLFPKCFCLPRLPQPTCCSSFLAVSAHPPLMKPPLHIPSSQFSPRAWSSVSPRSWATFKVCYENEMSAGCAAGVWCRDPCDDVIGAISMHFYPFSANEHLTL